MKNNILNRLSTILLFLLMNLQHAYAQKDSILLKVYFSEGKYVLNPASKNLLKNFAARYKNQLHINIAGRGDRHGSDALNDSLSLKRALTVKNFLIANDFPRANIHAIIGYGRRNPVKSGLPYVDSDNRVVWITVYAGDNSTAGGNKVLVYRDSLVLVSAPYPTQFLSLHPSIKPGDTLMLETRSRQIGDTLRTTRVIYLAGQDSSTSKPEIQAVSIRDSLIKLLPPYPPAYLVENKNPLKGDTLHIDTTMKQVNTTLFITRKIYIANDTTRTVSSLSAKEIPEKTKAREIARAFLDSLQKSSVGQSIIIRRLNFEFGYHVMPTTDLPALEAVSAALKTHLALKLEIRGHVCCGDLGEDVFDKQTGQYDLSTNRAKEVYDFLIVNGIDKNRISYAGYGMKQPMVYPEKSKNDQYRNRRIEFVIVAK
jgi:outer membrane protein OmpA-like peptidoglycan-associated protein